MKNTVPNDPVSALAGEVETWVFDLDNTLYRTSPAMHGRVDELLGCFVSEFLKIDRVEARTIQKAYFREFGLTLRGLMVNHDLDPREYFDYMMRDDLYDMTPDPRLTRAIARLPGRKVIYTNASAQHADKVLGRMEIGHHFDAVYDIEAADYLPKPAIDAYAGLCRLHGIDAEKAVMVDDIVGNLKPAAELGMTTVWVRTNAEWARDVEIADYVDHVTDDLAAWIETLVEAG